MQKYSNTFVWFSAKRYTCVQTQQLIVFIFQASTLLGQYLILKRNRDKFDKWFKEVCDASTRETDSCFDSLDQWCLRFLY